MYPPVHKMPDPLVPRDFSRLDMLWKKYPKYREMQPHPALEEFLALHESYRDDFTDEDLQKEYEDKHFDRFLVRLAWTDLPYRQATRKLMEKTALHETNPYVNSFMEQFQGWDTDRKAYFIFPESCVSAFFVILEICKKAEIFHPIRNLFPDEDKVHFLAVFDKQDMDTVLLMFHMVYGNGSQEMPGGYSLYDYSLPWYLTHLWQDEVVFRTPFLPDRLAKYQGGLLYCHNPARTVYVRRNIDHILESGYYSSELNFFRDLSEVMMPVFQWWYQDLAAYEEKDGLKTSWRLERTKIRTRLTADGVIKPKWKHELSLFQTVHAEYPDTLYQYRPEWLGHQSLDLFIPSLNTAIEYQGVQHYTAVDFFGGEEALTHRQELDRKKTALCKTHGVKLIEWPYSLEPTAQNLNKVIS